MSQESQHCLSNIFRDLFRTAVVHRLSRWVNRSFFIALSYGLVQVLSCRDPQVRRLRKVQVGLYRSMHLPFTAHT